MNPGAADEIASDTGGKSYYGSDGLKQALADANGSGSHYYTLSYSPSDKGALGRYRRIAVKLRKGHFTLAYRRGYFEEGGIGSPRTARPRLRPIPYSGCYDEVCRMPRRLSSICESFAQLRGSR